MMTKILRSVALWLGVLFVIAFVLLFFEADQLWKVGQHNTFLYSSLYFKQMMVVPGGMLSWAGAFFTQFFYHPWQGVVMLCLWWLLLMWLTQRAFNIPEKWKVLTVIPVAVLLIANMSLGYWVYLIKLPGYFFMPTIGVTVGAALLWGFRKIVELSVQTSGKKPLQRLWMPVAYIVLTAFIFYPLMGVYALGTVVLMAVMTTRCILASPNRIVSLLPVVALPLLALLCVIVVPQFYYSNVYYQTNSIYLYSSALPAFAVAEEYPEYYKPYYALAVSFLLLTLAYRFLWMKESAVVPQKDTKKGKGFTFKVQWLVQGAILLVLAGCVNHFWYKDDNFHHELRMQRCLEQADWEGVIAEGQKQEGEPTRAIVMMHNLALSRLGRQCSEMGNFPKGSKKPNTPLPVYMYHVAGRMMLYHYGLTNECHRLCMEDGVEMGWSVELLQYLTRCAIINGEKQVARKYLDLLRQTQFYGDWADRMEKLLNDPQQLANDSETGPITHMRHYSDRLEANNGAIEKYIMTTLAQHDADDLYFQEQAVLAALWTREPGLFWPRIEHYMELSNGSAPRIFQEAVWLFGSLEGVEGMDEWELQPGVKESFQAFMQMLQQYQKKPNPMARDNILAKFGNTYYFDYFFLRNITYY